MQRFLSLPAWARAGTLVLVAVLAVVLALWAQSLQEKDSKQRMIDNSVDINNSPTSHPTAASTSTAAPIQTPSSAPTKQPNAGSALENNPAWVGQMNLEVEDAKAASEASQTAVLEYYLSVPTETQEARVARLTPLIVPGSDLFNTSPWGNYKSTHNQDGTTIDGSATANTEDPIGGNGNEYRTLISINSQMVLTFPADSGERPQIFQGYQNLEVRMVKINGTWMLAQVIEK